MFVRFARMLRLAVPVALVSVSTLAAQGDRGWNDLVALDRELSGLGRPPVSDGVPQFTRMSERADAVADVQRRLRAIDAQAWSVAGKVDYLLVWARANGIAFEHRVNRPWEKRRSASECRVFAWSSP